MTPLPASCTGVLTIRSSARSQMTTQGWPFLPTSVVCWGSAHDSVTHRKELRAVALHPTPPRLLDDILHLLLADGGRLQELPCQDHLCSAMLYVSTCSTFAECVDGGWQ